MGEFGPGVDGGLVGVHRDAARRPVVRAAFFAGGHGGDFLGEALFALRVLRARDRGSERNVEGFARGVGFHVSDAERDFLFAGVALVDGEVERGDAFLVALEIGEGGSVRELAGGLDDEGAVHEEERLGGNDGFVAAAARNIGAGEIELREEFGRVATVDVGVDGAAGGEIFGAHADGFAAELGLEGAGDCEEGIVELLEVEATEVGSPKVMVVGVLNGELRIIGGALAVSCAGHDEAVEVLDGPTAFDEAGGEVVEKFGMSGRGGHVAEVVGGGDEAGAEVLLPDSVHEDAGGHGVLRIDDGEGELEAAATLFPIGAIFRIG